LILSVTINMIDFMPSIEPETFSVDFQTLLREVVCAAMGIYGLANLKYTQHQFFRMPGAWGTLFAIWATISVFFSISFMYSAAAVFSLWCVMLFVPAILARLGGRATLETLLTGLLLYVGVNWSFYFAIPSMGQSAFVMPNGEMTYRFGNDAQQLGLQVAWATGLLLALTFAHLRSWRTTLVILPILGVTLLLTQSRTAMLATAASVSVVIWQALKVRQRWLSIALAVAVTLVGLILLAVDIVDVDADRLASAVSRSGDVDELTTMTGRASIWEGALEKIGESPIVGWGFAASRFALDDGRPEFIADHAHNLWLNIALCLGAIGVFLLLAMIIHLLVGTIRHPCPLPAMALAVILLASISEPLLYGPMPRSHMVIWIIALFWQQMGCDETMDSHSASSEY
jgi:O-antigen ligase